MKKEIETKVKLWHLEKYYRHKQTELESLCESLEDWLIAILVGMNWLIWMFVSRMMFYLT